MPEAPVATGAVGRKSYQAPAVVWRGSVLDFMREHPQKASLFPLPSPDTDDAGPQLENGFLRLSNELAEALTRTAFTGRQFRLVLAILRGTYGFNRKTSHMGLRWLSSQTGLARNHCAEVRAQLFHLNVLSRDVEDPTRYGLNKMYRSWGVPSKEPPRGPKLGTGPKLGGSPVDGTKGVPPAGTLKDNRKTLRGSQASPSTLKPSPKRPARVSDPRVKVLVDRWAEAYLEAKGIKCAHLGVAGKVFKGLLETLTPEQIERHFRTYLSEPHFRGHHIGGLPDFIAKGTGPKKLDNRRAGLGPEGVNPYARLAEESRVPHAE